MGGIEIGALVGSISTLLGIVMVIVNLRKSSDERAKRETKSDVLLESLSANMEKIKEDLDQIKENNVDWLLFKQRIETTLEDNKRRIERLEKGR